MSVVALIPARNEPEIGLTVDSVLRQTMSVDAVIVITNNCTDDGATERIARQHGATVFDLGQISGMKAGAMNIGLIATLQRYPDTEFIMQMDADTILDKNFVERTVTVMRANHKIGGLGASFIGRSKSASNLFNKYLVWAQRQEFARFHAGQLTHQTSVLSGTATLLRVEALRELDAMRGYVWDTECIVEDYEATKALQTLGWLCMSDTQFVAHTDVMTTWNDLLKQRVRWQRGTLQLVFRDYKGRKSVRFDAWRQRWAYGMVLPHLAGYVMIARSITVGYVHWLPFIAVWIMFGFYNGWATRHAGWKTAMIAATIVPLELYNFVRYMWMWQSWRLYRGSLSMHNQTW